MTTATPHAATRLPQRLNVLAGDIKLHHSVFALPFALLATFLAAAHAGRWPTVGEFVLIVLCMVLARTFAMAMNRWADRYIDAANPRTAKRAIPAGRVSASFVLLAAAVCAGAFVASAAGFLLLQGNVWPLLLSPLVLVYLAIYAFTKRFTWFCHLYLGSALAVSPLAATIAIEPAYLAQPPVWLLAVMVTCWVAGFDIIYALQDVAVDRAAGLFSMPARLGENTALWIARTLHLLAAAALLLLWQTSEPLSLFFLVAIAFTIALLLLEHALVWGSKTNHLNVAFFTLNGVISLLLGAAGVVDSLL